MPALISLDHAYLLVLAITFVEFSGLPVAASIVLLGVGAATMGSSHRLPLLIVSAATGAAIADTIWFYVGRLRGRKLVRAYCAVTLSSHDCTARTERFFGRLGPRALIVAKFVPGLAALAAPFSGLVGTPARIFWTWDAIGSLLWSATFLSVGRALGRSAVDAWRERVSGAGSWVWGGIAALAAGWIVMKLVRRVYFGASRLEQQRNQTPSRS